MYLPLSLLIKAADFNGKPTSASLYEQLHPLQRNLNTHISRTSKKSETGIEQEREIERAFYSFIKAVLMKKNAQ
ncbi:hypothetical protein GCM10007876_38010 [Litoribrevibacter albus]|uniref:Uncharacterized protein n=1 Tax=Litoribrevibacter albus TaxID=1473156 RepID=A0AA37SFB7_9GAMM|nr:hypothetical protein GCM10007876_38010 [Litoribrevibacter albus]